MSEIKHIIDASFEADVLKATGPVLVDIWAAWCGPCKAIAPILDELAVEYDNRLQIVKMDADANRHVLAEHNVRGIPTLLLFNNGELVGKKVGAVSKGQLEVFLNTNQVTKA